MTLQIAKVEKAAALCRDDLLFYVQCFDPRYVVGPMHRYLADKLHRVERGEIKRLIINVPPRHGKSRLVSVELPTWWLARNPRKQIITTAYGANLPTQHSRQSRERVLGQQYQHFFTKTRLATTAALEWTTTEGGGYKASGIGGGITGYGGDLIIVDDPFKDYAEAHSLTVRNNVWDWFWSTAYTRLSTGGAIIIIMTRWHVDDLVGRLLNPERQQEIKEAGIQDEEWTLVNLPALADPQVVNPDPLGRQEGEPLSPERIPLTALKAKRQVMGGYLFGAQFQGRPVRKGGNYCNPDHFHIVAPEDVPVGMCWMRYWDLATTEKTMASYTAGVAGGLGPPPGQPDAKWDCLYLKDMIYGQWEWPRARERIKTTAEVERILVGVEAVAGFKTAYQNLREELPPDIASQDFGASRDKLTRALPWFALSEPPHRKVYLVSGDWVPAFKSQVDAFPAADFDDMVDAVSGVYNMLKSGRIIMVA